MCHLARFCPLHGWVRLAVQPPTYLVVGFVLGKDEQRKGGEKIVKRIVMVLAVALVMAMMLAATAAPAFASKGPFVGTKLTGDAACIQSQFYNNPINPQQQCGGDPL